MMLARVTRTAMGRKHFQHTQYRPQDTAHLHIIVLEANQNARHHDAVHLESIGFLGIVVGEMEEVCDIGFQVSARAHPFLVKGGCFRIAKVNGKCLRFLVKSTDAKFLLICKGAFTVEAE